MVLGVARGLSLPAFFLAGDRAAGASADCVEPWVFSDFFFFFFDFFVVDAEGESLPDRKSTKVRIKKVKVRKNL
jgi:hypothetical protein